MAASRTVFVAQPTVHPDALDILERAAAVIWGLPANRPRACDTVVEREDLAVIGLRLREVLPDVNAIFGRYPCDRELIEAATSLRVIISPTSGTEHIDIDAATANGVAVVNAAGANLVEVAEHVFGIALSLLKLIAVADRGTHRDRQQSTNMELFNQFGLPTVLRGKTLGIVGLGFIGRECARIAVHGFGMRVLAYDPYFDPVEAGRQGVTLVPDLSTLLSEGDVVSLSCPLNPATHRLMDAARLGLMKPTSILINCSRGATVVTDDLVAALRSGVIAGAGLDVTDPEPLPADHDLFAFDNVVLTSHIGGVSEDGLARQSMQSARDGVMVLDGEKPFHLVNPAVWPSRRIGAQ